MTGVIEPIVRALQILETMNQGPLSTIQALHKKTGLPKSTIHRLLATLIAAGYVNKDAELGVYFLTSKVLGLSESFHYKSWLVEIGSSVAEQITENVKWPVAIATAEEGSMVVLYSTRPNSPLKMRGSTVNKRFPMFASAMGQAYLAFCDADERDQILELLREFEFDPKALIHNKHKVSAQLNKVRKLGYGLRVGNLGESTHMALPIFNGEKVEGVMGISVFSSCFDEQSSAEYLRLLKDAVDKISDAIASRIQ